MQPHILLRRHQHRALNRPVHLRGYRRFITALQRFADIFKNNQFVTAAVCLSAWNGYMLVKSARPAVIPFVPRRKADGSGYELIILEDIGETLQGGDKASVPTLYHRPAAFRRYLQE